MVNARDLFDTISWDNIITTNTTTNTIRYSDTYTTTIPTYWGVPLNAEPSFTFTTADNTFDTLWKSFVMAGEPGFTEREEELQPGNDDEIDEFLNSFVQKGDDNE